MKEIEIKDLTKIKEIELDILKEFKRICEKHKIIYSLAYGTLLGAVRHNGFIPWDDDIDVMLPRPEFIRFLKIAKFELKDSNFAIASSIDDSSFYSPLAKMYDIRTRVYQHYGQLEGKPIGVYIDLFVVDGLPENNQEDFYNTADLLRKKWGLSIRKFFARHISSSFLSDICWSFVAIPYKLIGYKHYRNAYEKFCSSQSFDKAEEVAVVIYGEGLQKERMPKSWLYNRVKLLFEDEYFEAIECPDKYLVNMYGNYMKLPPDEKRVSKHPHTIVQLVN